MKILLICDDHQLRSHLKRIINENTHTMDDVGSLTDAKTMMAKQSYEAVVCAIPILSHAEPFSVLAQLQAASASDTPVIFLSQHIEMSVVIELVKKGLSTWVRHPEQVMAYLEQLPQEAPRATSTAGTTPLLYEQYVRGISPEAQAMYKQIDLVAPTNLNVIIYGETGTGKESVARRMAISRSPKAAYISLDCGCLSQALAASELFGCTKGAFTGAHEAKAGAFEQAHGGTLFLDEIANLDYEVQTFLLRVLQERKVRRVGALKEVDVSVRIVVASNENLGAAVKKGVFREDLYHRLNEFEIVIPPLRNRKADIPVFAARFLSESNEQFQKQVPGFQPEVLQLFKDYSWPGNIRELKNVVRRACLLTAEDQLIASASLPVEMVVPGAYVPDLPHEELFEASLKTTSFKAELQHIVEVLRRVDFNKTKAASVLNIDRKTLYNKLKKVPGLSNRFLKN